MARKGQKSFLIYFSENKHSEIKQIADSQGKTVKSYITFLHDRYIMEVRDKKGIETNYNRILNPSSFKIYVFILNILTAAFSLFIFPEVSQDSVLGFVGPITIIILAAMNIDAIRDISPKQRLYPLQIFMFIALTATIIGVIIAVGISNVIFYAPYLIFMIGYGFFLIYNPKYGDINQSLSVKNEKIDTSDAGIMKRLSEVEEKIQKIEEEIRPAKY